MVYESRMMKKLFTKVIVFTNRHAVLVLTFLILSLIWDAALVTSGSGGWTIAGALGGAAGGGYAASIIGGIGMVAMGTGVGIPAAAVVALGALAGGAAGGVGGAGIKALLSGEVVDFVMLAMLFCMSLGASVVIVCAIKGARSTFGWLTVKRKS